MRGAGLIMRCERLMADCDVLKRRVFVRHWDTKYWPGRGGAGLPFLLPSSGLHQTAIIIADHRDTIGAGIGLILRKRNKDETIRYFFIACFLKLLTFRYVHRIYPHSSGKNFVFPIICLVVVTISYLLGNETEDQMDLVKRYILFERKVSLSSRAWVWGLRVT